MMPNNIYITDTSALYCLFAGYADFGELNDWQQKAGTIVKKIFMENEIIIPMSAMTEMMGQLFHKKINLKKYDKWYRQRKILFNQFLIHPIFNDGQVALEYGSAEAGRVALELGNASIPGHLLKSLQGYYKSRIERNKKINKDRKIQGKKLRHLPRDIPKLFDGMDAMIVGEAIHIALRNPHKNHYFLCSDMWLNQGFDFAKQQSGYGKRLCSLKFLRMEKAANHVGMKW